MKTRESNFELLRIVAMLLVVLLHCNILALGDISQGDIIENTFSSSVRLFFDQSCAICVNLFILISGWFGIRPTLKGGINLLYQVYFFCSIIILYAVIAGWSISTKDLLKMFWFGSSYWFVTEYLLLYVISPVLNTFIEHSDKRTYLLTLLFFYLLEFALGWMIQFSSFGGGFYAIHFIGLYLLAKYIRLYDRVLVNFSIAKDLFLYLLLTLIPTIIAIYGKYYVDWDFGRFKYSSPFVVGASISILLLFRQFNIKSKIVNKLAISCFSIYIVHVNPIVLPHFKNLLNDIWISLNGATYILFSVFFALIFGIACMLADKIRIFTWDRLNNAILTPTINKIETTLHLYNKNE